MFISFSVFSFTVSNTDPNSHCHALIANIQYNSYIHCPHLNTPILEDKFTPTLTKNSRTS